MLKVLDKNLKITAVPPKSPWVKINEMCIWGLNDDKLTHSRVTLYTAGHLHTAVPHCSHSRAPIVHTAVPRENNEHDCVYLRCRAVYKLPGCVEGHPWHCGFMLFCTIIYSNGHISLLIAIIYVLCITDNTYSISKVGTHAVLWK